MELLASYAPCDIFNGDETALFFKLLPDNSWALNGDNCVGGKRSKDRVIVMVGANMTGMDKLPLSSLLASVRRRGVSRTFVRYRWSREATERHG